MSRPPIIPGRDLLLQVKAIPDAQWGPEMQALKPNLRAFVLARVVFGLNGPDAVVAAGSPSDSRGGQRVIASRWQALPEVAAAMRAEMSTRMLDSAPKMLKIVEGLARDKTIKPETRLKAASGLLDRAGMAAAQRIEVAHDHVLHVELTNEQLQADLERMLGRPLSAEALAALPAPIDAEFEPVEVDNFDD